MNILCKELRIKLIGTTKSRKAHKNITSGIRSLKYVVRLLSLYCLDILRKFGGYQFLLHF
nr:MAG TPA: hypothetical protein [Caudoviricetes sp.]